MDKLLKNIVQILKKKKKTLVNISTKNVYDSCVWSIFPSVFGSTLCKQGQIRQTGRLNKEFTTIQT